MHSSVEIFDDIEQLGDRFAETLAVRVNEHAGRRFYLALSGGRTPEPLLHRLTQPGLRDAAPWNKIEVFFTDERPVGPEHPESNYGMVKRAWLDCGAIPEGQVHRMHGEAKSLAAEAERYETLTYKDVLAKDLRVMDASAVSLMRDNHIPIVVFSIRERGNLLKVLSGEGVFTTIA
jgi:6-phosphogluconolactonase/glucosamine-6-phosphate isomerase/deaminase